MTADKSEIKSKIVAATIESIEKVGINATTTRLIASEAGVNIAAVNYYFGSKENLIKIALNATLKEAFINNINDYLANDKGDLRQDLEDFLKHNLEGMINYPRITKANLNDAFIHDHYEGSFIEGYSGFIRAIADKINNYIKQGDKRYGVLTAVQITSAVFFPGIFPKMFSAFPDMDLSTVQGRSNYVSFLLDRYLGRGGSI